MCSHALHESCKKCTASSFEDVISSDVTATRVLSAVPGHIFPGKVVRLTVYNKKTKTNFQKLISKPFSTRLNLSNNLSLSKRCRSYKYYFFDVWRNGNLLGQQLSLNSINKLLFYKFQVFNLHPKFLIFPLLVSFSVHSELILSRNVTYVSFLWQCYVDFSEPIIVWWAPGDNFILLFQCLLNC